MRRSLCTLLMGLSLFCFAAGTGRAFPALPVMTSEPDLVQVFDVQEERVVSRLGMTPEIREAAARWLQDVRGVSPCFEIGTKSGIVIRIPLQPSLTVTPVPGVSLRCRELYALIPAKSVQEESPLLLAFSEEGRTYAFECNRSVLEPFLIRYGLEKEFTR
ncbi:hypothetical protein [Paenibacillus silviterrae]|uniref:hypothetical protein n=1 Tax=Paenibacillus silviterrae TaxID=3242194 RepID=UPI00254345AB|nr:hypothetical protein [Paenibacillus chinjuensis]